MRQQRLTASRCFLGISIVLFLLIVFSFKFEDEFNKIYKSFEKQQKPENFMMEMKIVKLEIEKEWDKIKTFSDECKSMTKIKLADNQKKLQWHQDALKRVDEFNEAIKNINALTAQQITDQQSLWGGHNPVRVFNKWPGIVLNGDLPLRPFKEEINNIAAEERFHQLMSQIHVHCFLQKRMGYYKDGGWDICLSDPYGPKRNNCLVYSFGINNDFSFDDDIDKNFGCKVNSYDPSMSVESHHRSENVYFHKIGLGGENAVNKNKWQLMTFSTILKENGHSDTIIDYLKIDIEGSEIPSLKQMIATQSLKNVKQLSFELHVFAESRDDLFSYYSFLYNLEKLGFRRYFHHLNPRTKISKITGLKRSLCHEIYYININFL